MQPSGKRIHDTILRLFLREWENAYPILLKIHNEWYLTTNAWFSTWNRKHQKEHSNGLYWYIPLLLKNATALHKHRFSCLDRFLNGSFIYSLSNFLQLFGIQDYHQRNDEFVDRNFENVNFLLGDTQIGQILIIPGERK